MNDQRVLLTFDKDFGELAFARGSKASCGVILFRVILPSPDELARFVVETLVARDDWEGRFTVVEQGRLRVRGLPRW